ncbi:MAG: hypothetical protein WCG27_09815, partial [Pseudomonadota bacterium]
EWPRIEGEKYMKNLTYIITGLVVLLFTISAFADVIFRPRPTLELSPRHLELTKISSTQGFQVQKANVANLLPGPGIEASRTKIAAVLNGRISALLNVPATAIKVDPGKGAYYFDKGSLLLINNDGSKMVFRNENLSHEEPVVGKIPLEVAERDARKFIQSGLKEVVVLGQGEELVFMGVQLVQDTWGLPDGTGRAATLTVANTAVFKRKIGGLFVIGGGSEIRVSLNRKSEVVAFDVDWPNYKLSNQSQEILPFADLDKLVLARTSISLRPGIVRRAAQSFDDFQCGLIDPGAEQRSPQMVLQAGCLGTYEKELVGPQGQKSLVAIHRFIPAGRQVIGNPGWNDANETEPNTSAKIPQ